MRWCSQNRKINCSFFTEPSTTNTADNETREKIFLSLLSRQAPRFVLISHGKKLKLNYIQNYSQVKCYNSFRVPVWHHTPQPFASVTFVVRFQLLFQPEFLATVKRQTAKVFGLTELLHFLFFFVFLVPSIWQGFER